MKTLLYGFVWVMMIGVSFALWSPPAAAHPLGNFSINQYSGVQVSPKGVGVDYVLDMAEIPAFQTINRMDTNHNRKPDPAEIANYPADQCQVVATHLHLNVDQRPLPLSVKHSAIEFPPGVGGLATLRLTCALEGQTSWVGHQKLDVENTLYPDRLGWQEMTVTAQDIPLQGNFKTRSITKRLTDYPTDLLSSPLNQRQLSLEVNPAQGLSSSAAPSVPNPAPSWGNALLDRSNNAFTRLITQDALTVPTVLIALLTAFIWGGFHALSPGHGKTIVGSYLVGSRGNVQHALFLGLTVTITHTAGIFALGLATLSTSQWVLTEQIYPWLSLLSGLLVMGIGLNLLLRRFKNHRHDHSHNHDHSHHHDHNHDHNHNHHHSHSHDHSHHHGHHGHSHLPPGADDAPITWSSLLALGISGGLLPCPSALVVLLSAIALGRVGFGLLLVTAFSLGLAGVLTGIGVLLLYAKQQFERLPLQMGSTLFPSVSALCITLLGLGITLHAIPQSAL